MEIGLKSPGSLASAFFGIKSVRDFDNLGGRRPRNRRRLNNFDAVKDPKILTWVDFTPSGPGAEEILGAAIRISASSMGSQQEERSEDSKKSETKTESTFLSEFGGSVITFSQNRSKWSGFWPIEGPLGSSSFSTTRFGFFLKSFCISANSPRRATFLETGPPGTAGG